MVTHNFNPSTQKADADKSLSSRPAWYTEQVPGQPGYPEIPCLRGKKNEGTMSLQLAPRSCDTHTHSISELVPRCHTDLEPQPWCITSLGQSQLEIPGVFLNAESWSPRTARSPHFLFVRLESSRASGAWRGQSVKQSRAIGQSGCLQATDAEPSQSTWCVVGKVLESCLPLPNASQLCDGTIDNHITSPGLFPQTAKALV